MKKNRLVLFTLIMLLLIGAFQHVSATNDFEIQIIGPDNSVPIDTWTSIEIKIGDSNSAYDIAILEAGFKSLPKGLEVREDLKTEYPADGRIVEKGTKGFTTVHKIEIRKISAAPEDNGNKNQTSTDVPVKTEDKKTTSAAAGTGDRSQLGLWMTVILLSSIAALAALLYRSIPHLFFNASSVNNSSYNRSYEGPSSKNNPRISIIRILIATVIILAMIAAGFVFVYGTDSPGLVSEKKTAEGKIIVNIDNSEYTLEAYVLYVIMPSDESKDEPSKDDGKDEEQETNDDNQNQDVELVNINIEKVWMDEIFFDDEGNPIGEYSRPEKITIILANQNPENATDTINELGKGEVAPDEKGDWKGTISVAKYDKEGEEINYSKCYLLESSAPGGFRYESSKPEKQSDGSYSATIWNYADFYEKNRPVEANIYAVNKNTLTDENINDAVKIEGVEFTLSHTDYNPEKINSFYTDADGKGSYSFTEEGTYILSEADVPTPYANDEGTIRIIVEKKNLEDIIFDAYNNQWVLSYGLNLSFHDPNEEKVFNYIFPKDVTEEESEKSIAILYDIKQEYLTLNVNKVWEDNSDYGRWRPKEFTLLVRKKINEGVYSHIGTISITSSSENSQICNFDYVMNYSGDKVGFERYKSDGSEWVYDISENNAGYVMPYVITYKKSDGSSYWMGTDSGGTITAWYAEEISVVKIWDDYNYVKDEAAALGAANEYRRPIAIEFDLVGMVDGKELWRKKQLIGDQGTQKREELWQKSVLAPVFSGSDRISYEVEENVPDGFVVTESIGTWIKNTPMKEEKVEPLVLTIKKVDESTGALLSGAVFTAKPLGNPEAVIITEPTDANGETKLTFKTDDFSSTEWEIMEQEAPEGYVPSKTVYKVVLDKTLISIKPMGLEVDGETKTVWQWNYSSAFGHGTHADIKYSAESGYTLTVSNGPSLKFGFNVRKKWIMSEPLADVIVQIKNGEQVVAGCTFEILDMIMSSNNSQRISGLPAYDRYGKLIEYTVHEVVPEEAGFAPIVNDQKIIYDAENIHEIEIANTPTMEVNGQVTWEDLPNSAPDMPDERIPVQIDIVLQRLDGDDLGDEAAWTNIDFTVVKTGQKTQADPGSGSNLYSFNNIPVYNASGNQITYRVIALDCPRGWECVGGVDNLIFRPETVTITLETTWDDNENEAQMRPTLYSDLLDAVGLYIDNVPIEETPYKDSCYRWIDGDKSKGDIWVAHFWVPKYAEDLETELNWDIKEIGSFVGYTNGEVVKGDDGIFRVTNTYTTP